MDVTYLSPDEARFRGRRGAGYCLNRQFYAVNPICMRVHQGPTDSVSDGAGRKFFNGIMKKYSTTNQKMKLRPVLSVR